MGLYKKSYTIYKNELTELKKQILKNKRKIAKLTESLIEYKRYLTINPKTGLPNHKIFVKDLEKLIKERNLNGRAPFAVLFIDLYKSMTKIEYSLDSCISDAIIAKICLEVKEVLERIYNKSILPDEKYTILSRGPLEGIEYNIYHSERNEELMIILRNIRDKNACRNIAGIIYNKITEPKQLEFNNDIIHLTCHMAAALYPENGIIKEELLSNTDIALRFVIEKNNKMAFYTEALGAKIREEKALESELCNAIKRNNSNHDDESIDLHFQPITDSSYRMIGAESLVRWHHPEKGILNPLLFMSLAEETGLIVPLGYFILERVCQYYKSWVDRGLVDKDFFLSINLSPKQFKQHNLVEEIDKILRKYSMKGSSLKIEITENACFDNPVDAAGKLEQLSKMGIAIMIDDCGAPGNAIYNLRKLPDDLFKRAAITVLKLDKSLIDSVHQYKDRLFFKHNLGMAWRLNFHVIIEGIETMNQEHIIKEIEQELVREKIEIRIMRQGFLFSKPVPEKRFIELLKRRVLTPG